MQNVFLAQAHVSSDSSVGPTSTASKDTDRPGPCSSVHSISIEGPYKSWAGQGHAPLKMRPHVL